MTTKWDTSCGSTTSSWDTSCGCSKKHTFSTAWSYSTSYSTAYTFKEKRQVSTDSEAAANIPTVKAAVGVMAIAGSLLALL
ncbi:unnamed protein product [Ambrosiozyma monospora]|uniref:Unnamed protein product n=1 Tax=Ambrosiozyma monospora TaxID=43982 RepID=A0A9W6T4K2_AMBMO|nr:unnamed protein product [Ambrosiozyma monospora]